MQDGVLLHVLKLGGGLRGEQIAQDGAEFTGGPCSRVLRGFLGGSSVDLQVAIAFLMIVVNNFGRDHVHHVPARLARFTGCSA